MAEPIQPIAFTVTDAVRYSGLSRSRLYVLIQSGDLPSFQVGGRRMIRRDALDSFFEKIGSMG
jgi:excisionase family DNA binding protein